MLLALLALAVAVGGCGGEDDGSTDGTVSNGAQSESGQTAGESGDSGSEAGGGESGGNVTRTDFIKQADAICDRERTLVTREVDKYVSAPPKSGDGASVFEEIVTELIVPELEVQIRELRALGTPSSAEQAANTLIANLEGLLKEARADPAEFFQAGQAQVVKSEKAAKKEGFKRCGGLT